METATQFATTNAPQFATQFVIGIDPGFSGALACLRLAPGSKPSIVDAIDMPTFQGLDGRETVDALAVAEWIGRMKKHAASPLSSHPKILAAIEKVSASPQMGVVSAFRFGQGYGAVCAVSAYAGLLVRNVAPAVWKAGLGLSSKKSESIEMAKVTFENAAEFLKLKRHDGRAEAMLLAWFISGHSLRDRRIEL